MDASSKYVLPCHYEPSCWQCKIGLGLRNEESSMAEPQLSVRSARARDLAHRLARRENRTIADVVERALESYEVRETGRESAKAFYARLAEAAEDDFDLEVVIRAGRRPHDGPKL